MELAEVARRKDADEQSAQAEREDVAWRPWIESTDVRDQQLPLLFAEVIADPNSRSQLIHSRIARR